MSDTSFGKLIMAGIIGAIVPTVAGYFYVNNLSQQAATGQPTTASIVQQLMTDHGDDLSGAQGDTGAAGASGAAGPKGDAGGTGPAGAAGLDGAAGPQGPRGEAGPQGEQGQAGANGAAGAAGAAADVGQVVDEVIRQLRASGAIQ